MNLYNTLTGKVEPFHPAGDAVTMYVCGITPYSSSHMGHALKSIVFDVLKRYLQYKGYKVKHIENITDIDDKMIKAAASEGISTTELAERNMQAYLKQMATLNVQPATYYPKATAETSKIIDIAKTLIQKGMAYEVDGSVYYRVRSFPEYGKLSHRSLDEMKAGARVEPGEDKEDPMDFALWKKQKPGEPAWNSPWGPGRPGWHIECSAMAIDYLGETIDIHGGGQDLIFPHHENEIAQSEAYTDKKPFARFWVHNGLLKLGENKMSKSLGILVTIDYALQKFSPDALRLFFAVSHYRSPIAFSEESILAQERAVERLRNALTPSDKQGPPLDPRPYIDDFTEAMDDDLNTPRAIAVLFDLAKDINRAREEPVDITGAQATLKELAGVLGITLKAPEDHGSETVAGLMDILIKTRAELRNAKQFAIADQIRNRLASIGFILEDTPAGTVWKRRN